MNVNLLVSTPNPVEVMYIAGRICRNKDVDAVLKEAKDKPQEVKEKFIQKLIKAGHESILEHVSFTFVVSNISRIATHQLVRHRVASYAQYSHRGMDDELTFIIPDSLSEKMNEKEEINNFIMGYLEQAGGFYYDLVKLGIPPEDARFMLPNGLASNIMFTMNGRELRHFLKLRLAKNAQWEIRQLAQEILKILNDVCPVLVTDIKEE
ncbi:MAG TPA: FAD-dependent thymidylate synthase [Dictyoglomaceae bacterium]|nr:FAD-dependent thymidylate synthase [Dictyoglomaceae bacterium]